MVSRQERNRQWGILTHLYRSFTADCHLLQITIAGFGSGALVFTPLVQKLTRHFAQMPEYLGPAEDFTLQTIEGKMFVDLNGTATEVVHAVSADIAKLAYSLPEGLYVVGSGSTGAAEALAVCAAGYFGVMMAAALALKTPHSSYAPDGMSRSGGPSSSVQPVSAIADVAMPEAIR